MGVGTEMRRLRNTGPVGWLLDDSYLGADHELIAGGRGIRNIGANSNYLVNVPTFLTLPDVDDYYYFEVHTGPGGDASYGGYIGFLDRRSAYDAPTDATPIGFGHVGWRGLGEVRWTGGLVSNAAIAYGGDGTGYTVAQCVVNPAQGNFWLGIGGTFMNGSLQTFLPRGDLAAITPQLRTFNRGSSGGRRLSLETRVPGDELILATTEAEFIEGLPTGAIALGAADPGPPFGTY